MKDRFDNRLLSVMLAAASISYVMREIESFFTPETPTLIASDVGDGPEFFDFDIPEVIGSITEILMSII